MVLSETCILAQLDFAIADEDMVGLRNLYIRDYGDDSAFPVYRGK